MARPATQRLKVNPPLGQMPTLQFCHPAELRVDPAYQRDIANGSSQALIRKLAQHWNWDLCQPLVVARRVDLTERLFVIDGQHRLEAARLRGDIDQLPCVIVSYASAADEAASFVHLNQQRRPLNKIDLFKAAVASEDAEARAILAAIEAAGLSIAPHLTSAGWKPGMIGNISGVETCWRRHGPEIATCALGVLAEAWRGKVLRYAGTIWPGIVAVCCDEWAAGGFAEARRERFITMLALRGQEALRADMVQEQVDDPDLTHPRAAEKVLRRAWDRASENGLSVPASAPVAPMAPAVLPSPDGKRWCDQCEERVNLRAAALCKSRFCSLRPALAGTRGRA